MEAILKFDLSNEEDKIKYDRSNKVEVYISTLNTIYDFIRERRKYHKISEAEGHMIDHIFNIISEEGIDPYADVP